MQDTVLGTVLSSHATLVQGYLWIAFLDSPSTVIKHINITLNPKGMMVTAAVHEVRDSAQICTQSMARSRLDITQDLFVISRCPSHVLQYLGPTRQAPPETRVQSYDASSI